MEAKKYPNIRTCGLWIRTKDYFSPLSHPQMKMLSPSSIPPQVNVWKRDSQETLESPPATPPSDPSCGSGVQAKGSSTWHRLSAWRWTLARRCLPWLTVAPPFLWRGAASTDWCTQFTRWAWRSPKIKLGPGVTLKTPGLEEEPKKTSARGLIVVSVASHFSCVRQDVCRAPMCLMLQEVIWGNGRGEKTLVN